MQLKKMIVPGLLGLMLVSGWAWFYAIPKYQENKDKKAMAAFFAVD